MHDEAITTPKKIPDRMTIDSNSAEWWSNWSDWLRLTGFVLGGLVTIVAVAGWAFSIKAGKLKDEASKQKDAALERYKQESAKSIAEANAKAAEANREAAQARLELAKIDPLNIPIRSIKAEVFLIALGDFSDWSFEPTPLGHPFVSLSLSSEDGALVILKCANFDSHPFTSKPDGEAKPDGRMFSVSFQWPAPDFFNAHEHKYWLDRNNVSVTELEKKLRAAVISLAVSKSPAKLQQASCIVTFNGNVTRKFSIPDTSDTLSIICLPERQ
jgi:hypothetical protein